MSIPNIPKYYLCKITLQIMLDPVIAEDGFTYERRSIEQWFEYYNISPMTRENIGNRLIPNKDMKTIIMDFLEVNADFIHEAIKKLTLKYDDLDFINTLIKANKDNLNRKDEFGQTPLHIAVINKKSDIIKFLLKKGANYKIRNDQNQTPKEVAKDLGLRDIINTLEREIKIIAERKTVQPSTSIVYIENYFTNRESFL